MIDKKDVKEIRHYTVLKLYLTISGLWPYHSLRDRYICFVLLFVLSFIIAIPQVYIYIYIYSEKIVGNEFVYCAVKLLFVRFLSFNDQNYIDMQLSNKLYDQMYKRTHISLNF